MFDPQLTSNHRICLNLTRMRAIPARLLQAGQFRRLAPNPSGFTPMYIGDWHDSGRRRPGHYGANWRQCYDGFLRYSGSADDD